MTLEIMSVQFFWTWQVQSAARKMERRLDGIEGEFEGMVKAVQAQGDASDKIQQEVMAIAVSSSRSRGAKDAQPVSSSPSSRVDELAAIVEQLVKGRAEEREEMRMLAAREKERDKAVEGLRLELTHLR